MLLSMRSLQLLMVAGEAGPRQLWWSAMATTGRLSVESWSRLLYKVTEAFSCSQDRMQHVKHSSRGAQLGHPYYIQGCCDTQQSNLELGP